MRRLLLSGRPEDQRDTPPVATCGAGGGDPPVLYPIAHPRGILRGTTGEDPQRRVDQKYAETVLQAGEALGVSSSTVSRNRVDLTATKLKEFQERSLADCKPFAVFLDTTHRGGEAFLVALGVDMSGQKMALGFWQGSSENHEICEALFRDLERRGLARSRRILFVTDGGSGLLKALRERYGKKAPPATLRHS